jgi:selenium metabolism protein YedF
MKKIDARGLDCPEPVVKTKKALQEVDEVQVMVDNKIAADNVTKLARKLNCNVNRLESSEEYTLTIKNQLSETKTDSGDSNEKREPESGKVFFITGDALGNGDQDLGDVLIRGFLKTLKNVEPLPAKIIFMNTGVKIPTQNEKAKNYLSQLAEAGVSILVCGTCLDYYELGTELEVGEISNMYEIVEALNSNEVVKL